MSKLSNPKYIWDRHVLSFVVLSLLLLTAASAYAVKVFKISNYGGGRQIWFEAEAYDERNPDNDQYYKVVDKDGAFGKTITRTGVVGGMIRWTFDISAAGGKGGTWYFWGRTTNPNNQSDYLLVLGDPGDKKIPEGPPFPGGDAVEPFDNGDDRIFEQSIPNWAWWGKSEGSTKDLQNGENTMYIFHRQGDSTVFWDVFMWADNTTYVPFDKDYTDAREMKAGQKPVNPALKLATSWGMIKGEY
ncbi:hypothetical protein FJZ31_22345 [Candidatus Poribacteria bacterium]|nr:hypothetical protein [Candidatus Poribacteria bacterium]